MFNWEDQEGYRNIIPAPDKFHMTLHSIGKSEEDIRNIQELPTPLKFTFNYWEDQEGYIAGI